MGAVVVIIFVIAVFVGMVALVAVLSEKVRMTGNIV